MNRLTLVLLTTLAFPARPIFAAAVFPGANPIVPEGAFLSDPAPRAGADGVLRLFGSRDEAGSGRYCSIYNDVYETRDLRQWTALTGVFASAGATDGLPGADDCLYAPDAMFLDGRWALFYCTSAPHGGAGVAFAQTPKGPFRTAYDYSWAREIDPAVFQDDDGKLYYLWGQFSAKIAELKRDLSGILPQTVRRDIVTEEAHGFHEGAQLVKRGRTYYLVYSDISRRGAPTCIGYATAPSPTGPYTYRGVIVDNRGCDPVTWNNHGGLVSFGGKWYVFYHRTTNGRKNCRKACVEPVTFDENGFIAEVEQTSHGVGPLLDPSRAIPARLACTMAGRVRIVTAADGREFLGRIGTGDSATWRYFDFNAPATAVTLTVVPSAGGTVEIRDGAGASYGRVTVPAGDGKTPVTVEGRLARPFPRGRQAVVFGFLDGRRFGRHRPGALFDLDAFSFR
jgi:hypothetical protein